MKKFFIAVVSLLLGAGSGAAQQGALTLKDITDGAYSPQHVRGVTPMKDGETYTQLSADGRRIERRSFRTGQQVGVLFDAATARGPHKIDRIDGYVVSPDETRILLRTETRAIYRHSATAVHYIYSVQNNKFEPLSEGGPQQEPLFSPDGNCIAFAREGNLFIVKLLFGNAETQVTKDGKPGSVLNGIPDWVYEEEFSTSRSFDFSADSRTLAWVRYDESRVPVYDMQLFKGLSPAHEEYADYPGSYVYEYPVAGQRNSEVCVMAYDIKDRVARRLDVPVDSDGYVPRICFTDDPDRLAVVALNRLQNRMDIYMVNPRSTVANLVLRETSDRYIRESAYANLRFSDGHFALLSDRSGYRQLYWYTLGGQLECQVTDGENEVTDFYGYDSRTGKFYYAACDGSPLRRAIFASDRNKHVRRLSTEAGTNSAVFASSMKYYLNVFSSAGQPPVTTLCDASGRRLCTLIDNEDLRRRAEAVTGTKEFFSFTTSSGVGLNGWMVRPRNFDATRKYPVIMYQYSGPGSQEVTDSWRLGFYGGGLLESYLADRGYICVCVDGRGTGGRGTDFEQCTYLRLGQLEAEDQVETALYLGTLPYVDKDNIGIWGWSFGGFNTLMAMTEGRPVFKAGVAIAAPSDWRYYDTVYTERYMRTPKENAAGYGVSPVGRADRLNGALLLVHGTADDNVHFRNVAEMSEALVQADKQFDMQIYTNRNHGIYGGNTRFHLFTRFCNFFDSHLKGK